MHFLYVCYCYVLYFYVLFKFFIVFFFFFFFQAEDGIRDKLVTGVQTCALPILTRLIAWAHFTYATALGYLSLVYDSAGVPRTDDEEGFIPPLEAYAAVNTFALAQYDSAIAYAGKAGISSLPAGWLTGPGGATVTPARLIQVTRSFKAKMRASVARTPTERTAVNWN